MCNLSHEFVVCFVFIFALSFKRGQNEFMENILFNCFHITSLTAVSWEAWLKPAELCSVTKMSHHTHLCC